MNIALITDKNYLIPTGTAIASILESNRNEDLHFFIITQNLCANEVQLLQSFVEPHSNHARIEIIALCDKDIADFPIRKGDHVSIATYFRIYFPKIIPESKLLFVDGDTLCVDSLKDFYNLDITNYSCAVCHDEQNANDKHFRRLKYPKENGYFCAGVMLINLDWWRKYDVMQKCLEYIQNEPEACLWHDQDALNHVLNGTVLWADFRYNFTQGFYFDKNDMCIDSHFYSEIDNARKNPCTLHFSSAYKPWHKECNHPLKKHYRDFYKEYTGKNLKLSHKLKGFSKIRWYLKKILSVLHIKNYADFRKPIDLTLYTNLKPCR